MTRVNYTFVHFFLQAFKKYPGKCAKQATILSGNGLNNFFLSYYCIIKNPGHYMF